MCVLMIDDRQYESAQKFATKEELKDIYEKRYTIVSQDHSVREIAQYRKYFKVLLNWDSSSCADRHYLDLGCGLGAKTVGFNNGFNAVKAVDLSEKAIANCRNKFSEERIMGESNQRKSHIKR